MLYICAGLPAAGKSTLSQRLAREVGAVHLRIDVIEHAMREAGITVDGPQGYQVAYALAGHNLRLGLSVVADSVNPLKITRDAWREVAIAAGAPFVEIEFICSDLQEHRRRVEGRANDIEGFALPDWQAVANRHYEAWDRAHWIIDTAGQTEEQSYAALRKALGLLA